MPQGKDDKLRDAKLRDFKIRTSRYLGEKQPAIAQAMMELQTAEWKPIVEGVWGVQLPSGARALYVHEYLIIQTARDTLPLPVGVMHGSVGKGILSNVHYAAFAHAEKCGAFGKLGGEEATAVTPLKLK